jgi:hypothetical protein
MRIGALHHTEMAGELVALWVVVSATVAFVLGHSPNETFWVKVVDELVVKIGKLEERHSQLEQLRVRICNLLLGPPSSRA